MGGGEGVGERVMMCGAAAERVRVEEKRDEWWRKRDTMLDMDGCGERAARRSHDAALATRVEIWRVKRERACRAALSEV